MNFAKTRKMNKILEVSLLCSLCVILVGGTTPKDLNAKAQQYAFECSKELGVTKKDVHDIKNTSSLKTRASECLRACVMKKFKVIDENGNLDRAVMRNLIKVITADHASKMSRFDQVIDICEKMELPSDHCDRAEAINNCLIQNGLGKM